MAMGKAVICSDMAQMSEILEHGKTAYMVKPGCVDALEAAMKALIDDASLRATMGANAAKEALRKYTWERHVDKILEAVNNG